jgi:hypothetical protein
MTDESTLLHQMVQHGVVDEFGGGLQVQFLKNMSAMGTDRLDTQSEVGRNRRDSLA